MIKGIPEAHAADATLSCERCPVCRERGRWRRGVYFEHPMRCGNCNTTWCPDGIEEYRRERAQELVGQLGEGI